MGHKEHKEQARGPVRCAVITVSDTRTEETDTSGSLIRELLRNDGHAVAGSKIVSDEPDAVEVAAREALRDAQAVIINGGTGISKRDRTCETVSALFDRILPGFGEIFRMLSFQEIGPAAMMSRAAAGIVDGRPVFLIPGSTGAVRLAMEKLILPELSHAVWECNR